MSSLTESLSNLHQKIAEKLCSSVNDGDQIKKISENIKIDDCISNIDSLKLKENDPNLFLKNLIEKKFCLNFEDFNNFLIKYNGFLGGGASTSSIICEEFKGTDLDIWIHSIPYEDASWIESSDNKYTQDLSVDKLHVTTTFKKDLENMILPEGYIKMKWNPVDNQNYKNHMNDTSTYISNSRFKDIIHKIYSYSNDRGNKIQLICTNFCRNKILKTFDFSFCATSWDGKNFYSLEPELTKNKQGYEMNILTPKEILRKNKYISRGFTIIKKPNSNISSF